MIYMGDEPRRRFELVSIMIRISRYGVNASAHKTDNEVVVMVEEMMAERTKR